LAEKELWEIKQVRYKLPGEFNIAASTLYGGRYQNIYPSDQAWATDDHSYDDHIPHLRGYSVPEAERIFKTAVAFEGTDELFLEAMNGHIHIVKTETRYFEVVQIDRVDMTSHDDYSKVKNHLGVSGSINALGRIHFQTWDGPGLDEEDLTDDEDAASSPPLGTPTTEAFWLEDHILHNCFVGMKLALVVHSLNIGIRFFGDILGIYCSFHTSLPNEKVIDNWKEPGEIHPIRSLSSILSFIENFNPTLTPSLQSPTPDPHPPKTTPTQRRPPCTPPCSASSTRTRSSWCQARASRSRSPIPRLRVPDPISFHAPLLFPLGIQGRGRIWIIRSSPSRSYFLLKELILALLLPLSQDGFTRR
jgi:hypothetical protein